MAKKSTKKAPKQLASETEAKQFDRDYPAEGYELAGQRQRLRKAAAEDTQAVKSSVPAATPDSYPAPKAASSPPLAPLAALWPDPEPTQRATKSAQAPAQQIQKPPTKPVTPQAPPTVSEPMQSPARMAGVAESPSSPVTLKIGVTFVLPEPDAKQVSLSGEFNGWSPDATPLQRYEGGHWKTTIALAPGRYQYKFVVDGEWIPDPLASEHIRNHYGTLNSVIEV